MSFSKETVALFDALLSSYKLQANDQNFESMAARISLARKELVAYFQEAQTETENKKDAKEQKTETKEG